MYAKIKEILKDIRLLVVEDDDVLRETLIAALFGYVSEIYACKNGVEGLEIYAQKSPSLILSDINMPQMSGLNMVRQIRANDEKVPILFLTAFDSDENVLAALELQSAGVLKKPFDKRELIMSMSFAANKFRSDFASVDLRRGFIFNAFTRELTRKGEAVALTKKEAELLHLLLKNRTRVVSFEMIESFVWCGESCTGETIRAFVYKLRKKLYPELIQNAQGRGYQINLKSENERTHSKITYV